MKIKQIMIVFVTIVTGLSSFTVYGQSNFAIPPNTTLTLNATAYAFDNLELNDGSVLNVSPSIGSVQISINTLVLHGKSAIDLTCAKPVPPTPAPKPGMPQANPDGGNTKAGSPGFTGDPGIKGADGIGLTLAINTLTANNGSLWIRTDGGAGGNGGNGGNGGKGSSGPQTCVHNPDGGNGGPGGAGGPGGTGGNTSLISVKIGGNIITPTSQSGVAPSSRPPESSIVSGIIIFGLPGAGGLGGAPGIGGAGGEGHENHFPCTASDSHGGQHGGGGAPGAHGPQGSITN